MTLSRILNSYLYELVQMHLKFCVKMETDLANTNLSYFAFSKGMSKTCFAIKQPVVYQ